MSSLWIICRKELKSYFVSPIAYGLMAFVALIAGWFFYNLTASFVSYSMQMQMSGQSRPMDMNEIIVPNMLGNMSIIFLFVVPMITMRMFAEEKRTGTIELLLTSPITDLQIILGKWLAALILLICLLGISALNLMVLFMYGQPDWRPIAVGYLGLIFLGGSLLAIGEFISTTSKNQIVAGAGTFAICLLLWVLNWITQFDTSTTATVLSYICIVTHLDPFVKGIIDSKDVIFYLSVIFFGLFLSARSMESLRWRA